jgi:hypothetical protein
MLSLLQVGLSNMHLDTIAEFLRNPLQIIARNSEPKATNNLIESIKAWVLGEIEAKRDISALRNTLITAAETTAFHQDFQLMFSELLSWTTPGQFDKKIFYSVMASAERSRFALFQYLKNHFSSGNPFFVSAFLPKSGGTFLSALLKDKYNYRSDIFYAYGSADSNYLIPGRVEVLKAVGGEFNHLHLGANAWNEHIVEKFEVPLWVHLRDPRDSFFSALSMMLRENERDTDDSRRYLDELRTQYGPDIFSQNINTRARLYIHMLESYCSWAKYWIDFEYPKKTITYHRELANISAFRKKINRCFGIKAGPISTKRQTALSYKAHRFNSGVNGVWKSSLDIDVVKRMQKIYKKYFKANVKW